MCCFILLFECLMAFFLFNDFTVKKKKKKKPSYSTKRKAKTDPFVPANETHVLYKQTINPTINSCTNYIFIPNFEVLFTTRHESGNKLFAYTHRSFPTQDRLDAFVSVTRVIVVVSN